MKKIIPVVFIFAVSIRAYDFSIATEEPTNFPPSPVDANTAPYATDPARIDTKETAKPEDNTTKADLDQRIATAIKAVNALQGSDDTRIPSWVVEQARAVLILHHWNRSILVGGVGGWGLGLKKTSGGNFGNPVFYKVEGASVGAQAGASETDTVVFLLSDKAIKLLTDDKFIWSGNLHAIGGSHSSVASTIKNNVDIILYRKDLGLDVGAAVFVNKLLRDKSSNRIFYGLDLAPDDIFNGNAQISDAVKSLHDALLTPAPALAKGS